MLCYGEPTRTRARRARDQSVTYILGRALTLMGTWGENGGNRNSLLAQDLKHLPQGERVSFAEGDRAARTRAVQGAAERRGDQGPLAWPAGERHLRHAQSEVQGAGPERPGAHRRRAPAADGRVPAAHPPAPSHGRRRPGRGPRRESARRGPEVAGARGRVPAARPAPCPASSRPRLPREDSP